MYPYNTGTCLQFSGVIRVPADRQDCSSCIPPCMTLLFEKAVLPSAAAQRNITFFSAALHDRISAFPQTLSLHPFPVTLYACPRFCPVVSQRCCISASLLHRFLTGLPRLVHGPGGLRFRTGFPRLVRELGQLSHPVVHTGPADRRVGELSQFRE